MPAGSKANACFPASAGSGAPSRRNHSRPAGRVQRRTPRPFPPLVLVADPAVPQGIALLDAPDVDSISDDNRRLAGQLLAAADLWIFVTTANRYADAVPWKLLLDASSRDIMVAVVLDRVPAGGRSRSQRRPARVAAEGRPRSGQAVRGAGDGPGWPGHAAAGRRGTAAGLAGGSCRRRRGTFRDCPADAERDGQGVGRQGQRCG